jgi:hypothetical protein
LYEAGSMIADALGKAIGNTAAPGTQQTLVGDD